MSKQTRRGTIVFGTMGESGTASGSDLVPPPHSIFPKIVLLVLSGDRARAWKALKERYPNSDGAEISRSDLEKQGVFARLNALRAHQPDVFAVSTERLEWQRGQNFFLLLGALAGARHSIILDNHGGWRGEDRLRTLAFAPARLAREVTLSATAVAQARRELASLESAVQDGSSFVWRIPKSLDRSEGPRITYLRSTPGAGSHVGGASSHIKGVTDAMLELGAQLRFICNDNLAGLDSSRSPVTVIRPDPAGTTRAAFDLRNSLLFARKAAPEIGRDPPDFIYERYSRFGYAGVVASLRTGRPLFLEYNGSEVWVGRHWDKVGMLGLLARFERLNLAAAARIFVVSDVDRRNLVGSGVSPEKILVNPNGVDPERFRPNVGGQSVREELGVSDDETLVGFVGTFGPWHGVLELAEAIKQIPASTLIRFLLVGTGSLRGEVEQLLEAEWAAERVIFTGAVEHERVPDYLDACEVLVSPHVPLADGSEFFGSPTKLFEYMAMGKGIVASRLGQIGDVLTNEETALLVEPGDVGQLVEGILRLAGSRHLRERLGAAAREAAITRHTWTRNARNVLDAYSRLGMGQTSRS